MSDREDMAPLEPNSHELPDDHRHCYECGAVVAADAALPGKAPALMMIGPQAFMPGLRDVHHCPTCHDKLEKAEQAQKTAARLGLLGPNGRPC